MDHYYFYLGNFCFHLIPHSFLGRLVVRVFRFRVLVCVGGWMDCTFDLVGLVWFHSCFEMLI